MCSSREVNHPMSCCMRQADSKRRPLDLPSSLQLLRVGGDDIFMDASQRRLRPDWIHHRIPVVCFAATELLVEPDIDMMRGRLPELHTPPKGAGLAGWQVEELRLQCRTLRLEGSASLAKGSANSRQRMLHFASAICAVFDLSVSELDRLLIDVTEMIVLCDVRGRADWTSCRADMSKPQTFALLIDVLSDVAPRSGLAVRPQEGRKIMIRRVGTSKAHDELPLP
jgi:hypothetical protein